MATIRDVARRCGVSPTTVSLVLNEAPLARYIPAKTKRSVRHAAEELGYRPNPFARALRSKRSQTVGVMVFDIADPYCTQVLRGIQDALYQASYLALVTDIQNSRSRFLRYIEMLLDRHVEGLIALGNSLSLQADLLPLFEEHQIPTVMIGRQLQHDSIHSVVVDNAAGARMALEHLFRLGHRKIAVLRGPRILVDSGQRWKGLLGFAEETGLRLDERLVLDLKETDRSDESGYELTRQLVQSRRSFTALVAFDDLTAFGAVRALQEAGRQVPRDCSVVGFDDLTLAGFFNPPLTTVRQPTETLGTLGAEILTRAIAAANQERRMAPAHRLVAPQLVTRASTAPLR